MNDESARRPIRWSLRALQIRLQGRPHASTVSESKTRDHAFPNNDPARPQLPPPRRPGARSDESSTRESAETRIAPFRDTAAALRTQWSCRCNTDTHSHHTPPELAPRPERHDSAVRFGFR